MANQGETFFGHAVQAAEITPVCHRYSQVIYVPVMLVDHNGPDPVFIQFLTDPIAFTRSCFLT
jgi:hypothetical protein